MYTKNKKLDASVNPSVLVKFFDKLSCAAIETILNEAAIEAELQNRDHILLVDIAKAGEKTGLLRIKNG